MNADMYTELFGLVAALDDSNPDATLGSTSPIGSESLRFKSDSSLAFLGNPAQQVSSNAGQTEVTTALFSLLGPIGSLPYVYSEIISRADRANETAMRDFFDLFNHRSASLMYRAWRKSRMWLENQPGRSAHEQRRISGILEGLTGIAALPNRIAWLDFERDRILSCANVFPRRVRNSNGLRQLLNRQFGMKFQIEEFVGNWEPLPEEARSVFSSTGSKLRLGYNTILGSRTWQAQSTFRVVISHPEVQQYRELQPGSESLRRMQLLVRLYCTPELSFRIQIIVRGDTIEPGKLGASSEGGVMLGWNTVLGKPDKDKNYSFSICRDYNESRMSL
jgi:type VI secretion system protein ImpH